jgi:hypothetical protein
MQPVNYPARIQAAVMAMKAELKIPELPEIVGEMMTTAEMTIMAMAVHVHRERLERCS